jgi:hypothetical protein
VGVGVGVRVVVSGVVDGVVGVKFEIIPNLFATQSRYFLKKTAFLFGCLRSIFFLISDLILNFQKRLSYKLSV